MISLPRVHLGPLNGLIRAIRDRLPEVNFITIHYAYFIFTSLLTAVIFWGASTPFQSVRFIDSLFLTMSAMTEAGLNTVNLSQLNTFQQVLLFLLIMAGSSIFVSGFVVWVRVNAFEKAFKAAIKEKREARQLKRMNTNFGRMKSLVRRPAKLPPLADVMRDARAAAQTDDTNQLENAEKSPVVAENEPESSNNSSEDSKQRDEERGEIKRTTFEEPSRSIRLEISGEHGGASGSEQQQESKQDPALLQSPVEGARRSRQLTFQSDTNFPPLSPSEEDKRHRPLFSITGIGATHHAGIRRRTTTVDPARTFSRAATIGQGKATDPYFKSIAGYVTGQSQFLGLTIAERHQLGGSEYDAILFLGFLVPLYFFIWQFLGALALGAWVNNNRPGTAISNGVNPWWAGAFNAVSAFNNSGMSLVDANMIAYQTSIFMLLSMGLFILAGNTAYPLFLRAAIWTLWKVLPDDEVWSDDKRTLRFLLDHPRRCYTNLFPSRHTWWLAYVLLALNAIDWAMFEILNVGNHKITELSPGIEVVDGFFQALAVRSGGFYVVPIPNLRISLQFLYVIMMYISVYPVTITMRNSNVYEERSLGIFEEDIRPDDQEPPTPKDDSGRFGGLRRRVTTVAHGPRRAKRTYFVRHQLRAQLGHDLWWLAIAIFLILIIEGSQFEAHPATFSVFNVIFEVISGYACVGLSIGVPYNSYSFSGSWHTLSKLIMVVVMLRGRHRGLPVAIDQAVQLPGKKMFELEEDETQNSAERMERNFTNSTNTTDSAV